MKKAAKIFYGVLIFIFSTGFLYYIGNTAVHIILDYKEKTQENPFFGYGFGGIWGELYGKEYSIAFMAMAIIVLFVVAVIIALFYRTRISKLTLVLSMAGFLVPIIYMIAWLRNIGNNVYEPPSSLFWFIIFTVYAITTVILLIKDAKRN